MSKYIKDKKLLSTENKDTTWWWDSCMTVWLASSNYVGRVLRENFYYELFKKTDISPKYYRKSCAILESFWRLNFTKILSWVLFRLKEPNINSLPKESIEKIYEYVDKMTISFAWKDLEWFVNGTKKSSNWYVLYSVDKLNKSNWRGSLEILCERLWITWDDIEEEYKNIEWWTISSAKINLIKSKWNIYNTN